MSLRKRETAGRRTLPPGDWNETQLVPVSGKGKHSKGKACNRQKAKKR
jgi:hypothetical protein